MPIAPQLQRFIDDELASAATLIERTLAGTMQALRGAKGGAGAEAQPHQLLESLRRQAGLYQGGFIESLRTLVQDGLREQHGGIAIELMDEAQVEVDIEISRAMQLIDTTAEWELVELQTFTSSLIGQAHVSPESNPLQPFMYATALWDAACVVASAQAQRAALLRVSAGVMAGLLKTAWAAACIRLQSQGVEPGIYSALMLAPGPAAPAAPAGIAARGGPRGSSLAALLVGVAGQTPTRRAGNPQPRHTDPGHLKRAPAAASRPSPELDEALQRLDELMRELPDEAPAPRDPAAAALSRRLELQRDILVGCVDAAQDRHVIEMLSRLFEALLSDPLLNPAVRPVLARLQASALRVALADASVFEGFDHPVWQLIDRVGEVAAAYPHADDPRLLALRSFCQPLAEEIAGTATPGARLFRRGLARLDAFLAEQLQSQVHEAEATIAKLTRIERRDVLEQQISKRLVDEIEAVRISPSLRRFIVGPWAKVLAEALLRFGEDGKLTALYLKTVEDLLWSLRLPDQPQSRQRLVGLLPEMLKNLREGMALINVSANEQQAVLDELMQVHTEALRFGSRSAVPPASAEEIVQRMRNEVLEPAPHQRPYSNSVIDLASMETVPANLMPDRQTTPTQRPARQLDEIVPGVRRRMFLLGRWTRAQLLWRSPQSELFLFAGEHPGRPHSITRRALERLMDANLVRSLP